MIPLVLIRLVAPHSASVLLEGETETGKEVVAKAIHQLSKRAGKPINTLNCAAIPEALLEVELFDHTRGAFTGAAQSRVGRIEAANGGTLFLDEIGEMPIALQSKLLRFLDCGELQRVGDNEILQVDVRVIATTHQHLEKNAAEGRFRLDLFHRLAVFPIAIPPLRDRKQDIPELAEHFLPLMGKDSPRKRLTARALSCLAQSDFPGNVRELAHILERATILAGYSPTSTPSTSASPSPVSPAPPTLPPKSLALPLHFISASTRCTKSVVAIQATGEDGHDATFAARFSRQVTYIYQSYAGDSSTFSCTPVQHSRTPVDCGLTLGVVESRGSQVHAAAAVKRFRTSLGVIARKPARRRRPGTTLIH